MRKIIIILTNIYIQILLAIVFALLASVKLYYCPTTTETFGFREIAIILASIASILALTTSITFAFAMNSMNSSNNRVAVLFIEFKNFLFKTDQFLDSLPKNVSAVEEARVISYNLKIIENDDIPLNDWDKRLEDFMKALDKTHEFEHDKNLGKKILEYLGHLEYLLSEIGVLRIRQIITGVFIKTLFKGFVLLAMMIISILILLIFHQNMSLSIMIAFPVLFGTFTALLILEIGWWIKREEEDMMSFIEDEKSSKKDKK